jgi:hypothetical protein
MGQTRTAAEQSGILRSESARQPKADLKNAFASEIGTLKSPSLTKVELSRITAGQTAQPPGKFSNRQKVFLAFGSFA